MRNEIITYGILRNVDDSILILNELTEKDGFSLIKLSLVNLYQNFSKLFYHFYVPSRKKQVKVGNDLVDSEFFKMLISNQYLLIKDQDFYVVFLKCNSTQVLDVSKKANFSPLNKLNLIKSYLENLVLKLRLLFPGNIGIIGYFSIEQPSKRIVVRGTDPSWKQNHSISLCIDKKDLRNIQSFLKYDLPVFDYFDLALKNFELSYSISNISIRFISLVTSLECLFNFGKEQIAHTISRHTALLSSSSKQDLHEHYYKIKKLYNKRNAIVHGTVIKDKLTINDVNQLEGYVRISLHEVAKLNLEKRKLFDYLNTKGF